MVYDSYSMNPKPNHLSVTYFDWAIVSQVTRNPFNRVLQGCSHLFALFAMFDDSKKNVNFIFYDVSESRFFSSWMGNSAFSKHVKNVKNWAQPFSCQKQLMI